MELERLLWLALWSLAHPALAGEVPTIEELVSLKSRREVALSPDGKTVAYAVTEANWDDDQGLKDENLPVRLAIYKGFGHGLDEPRSNRAVMTHNEEWFSKWIGGE